MGKASKENDMARADKKKKKIKVQGEDPVERRTARWNRPEGMSTGHHFEVGMRVCVSSLRQWRIDKTRERN